MPTKISLHKNPREPYLVPAPLNKYLAAGETHFSDSHSVNFPIFTVVIIVSYTVEIFYFVFSER